MTLVRLTPTSPGGTATALFNWRASTMECSPQESVVLVLLLMVSFSEALHEMEGIYRVHPYARVRLRFPDPREQWDSVIIGAPEISEEDRSSDSSRRQRNSKQSQQLQGIRGEGFRGPGFRFSAAESEAVRWWSQGEVRKAPGAGSCGAGACGPSVSSGHPVELHAQKVSKLEESRDWRS